MVKGFVVKCEMFVIADTAAGATDGIREAIRSLEGVQDWRIIGTAVSVELPLDGKDNSVFEAAQQPPVA